RHTRFSRDWSSDVCSSDLSESEINPIESAIIPANSSTTNIKPFIYNNFFNKLDSSSSFFDGTTKSLLTSVTLTISAPKFKGSKAESITWELPSWYIISFLSGISNCKFLTPCTSSNLNRINPSSDGQSILGIRSEEHTSELQSRENL